MTEPSPPGADSSPLSWSNDRLESILRDTMDTQAQEQRELETLLADVRSALSTLNTSAFGSAVQGAVGTAFDRLSAQIAANAYEQTRELQALAVQLATRTPDEPGAGPSLQDVHDGLAGIRTDIGGLPDQIGPAVANVVAAAVSSTSSDTSDQVESVRQALADTVAETAALRSYLAELSGRLSDLPERLAGLDELTERLAVEVAVSNGFNAEQTDFPAMLDERLDAHLSAFGVGVGGKLDELLATMRQSSDLVEARLASRLAVMQDVLNTAVSGGLEAGVGSIADALANRLDAFEQQTAELVGGSEERVSTRLAAVERSLGESTETAAGSFDTQTKRLDATVADRLDAHLEALAQAFGERLDSLEEQLVAMRAVATETQVVAPTQTAEQFDELQSTVTSTVQGALARSAEQLAELGQRIDALHVNVGAASEAARPDAIDVTHQIESAVEASEARLTAHINEAVFALAEVLLRRPRSVNDTAAAAATAVATGADSSPIEDATSADRWAGTRFAAPPVDAPFEALVASAATPAVATPAEGVVGDEVADDELAAELAAAEFDADFSTPPSVETTDFASSEFSAEDAELPTESRYAAKTAAAPTSEAAPATTAGDLPDHLPGDLSDDAADPDSDADEFGSWSGVGHPEVVAADDSADASTAAEGDGGADEDSDEHGEAAGIGSPWLPDLPDGADPDSEVVVTRQPFAEAVEPKRKLFRRGKE